MTDAERARLEALRGSATLNQGQIEEYLRLLSLETEEAKTPVEPVEVVKPKKVYKKRK